MHCSGYPQCFAPSAFMFVILLDCIKLNFSPKSPTNGRLAQLVARVLSMHKVAGSIPAVSIDFYEPRWRTANHDRHDALPHTPTHSVISVNHSIAPARKHHRWDGQMGWTSCSAGAGKQAASRRVHAGGEKKLFGQRQSSLYLLCACTHEG